MKIFVFNVKWSRGVIWQVNFGSGNGMVPWDATGNGLVPSGKKPLPEPMLTSDLSHHTASLGHNYSFHSAPYKHMSSRFSSSKSTISTLNLTASCCSLSKAGALREPRDSNVGILENKSTLLTISRLGRYCGPSNYRFNFLLYWYTPWVFFWGSQCAFVFPIYVRKYRK